MLKLTKTGIGLLTKQYRSVLRKCLVLNAYIFLFVTYTNSDANSTLALRTFYRGNNYQYLLAGSTSSDFGDCTAPYTCTDYTIVTTSDLTWANISGRPTKLSQFTNDSGYITGITKAMVTSALGYTPPTTDTNTTYSAASSGGLSLSGTAFSIANNGVTTARIANSAVTDAKIASGITASKITQTASYRFVSDTEKSTWNAKQNALTTAQLNAANSGITAAKVSTYDGYATTIAGKADKATTLSGYGITNAYTKTETDSAISQAISGFVTNDIQSLNYYYTFRVDESEEAAEFALFLNNEKLSNVFEA